MTAKRTEASNSTESQHAVGSQVDRGVRPAPKRGTVDRAEWLADKLHNGGDYGKEAAALLVEQAKALADVGMMLKTCAWALRRGTAPELGERALELLKRHNLLGSPLRDETLDEAGAAAAAAALYDRWTGKA